MYTSPVSSYLPPVTPTANKLVVAVMGLLVAGTGSVYPIQGADSWWRSVKPRVSFSLAKESKTQGVDERLDVRSSVAHIENVREVMNPSMADLAAVFGVSRQAVYKWISRDSEPEPPTQLKIAELSRMADLLRSAKIERAGALMKMKAFDGQSLMDLIKQGTSKPEHVSALIVEAAKMQANYSNSGISDSKAAPSDSWKSYASIPGNFERA